LLLLSVQVIEKRLGGQTSKYHTNFAARGK
jgi:hypothetical protein